MTALVVTQAVSIVPPQIGAGAPPTQTTTLVGTGVLSPRVIVAAASIAPGARPAAAGSMQSATLAGALRPTPRVVALAAPTGALAARAAQSTTLGATGGTGPQPRPLQRRSLLAQAVLAPQGASAVPVPQHTLAASGLLTLVAGTTAQAYTWLVAGVLPVQGGATSTQSQAATGTTLVDVPLYVGARPAARRSLGATPQTSHPLAVLRASLWLARPVGRNSAQAGGALVPVRLRWPYRSARGLGQAGRYTFRSTRGLGHAGAYRFRTDGSGGGTDVVALAVPPTPPRPTLRRNDRLGVALDFGPDLAPGDSIVAATVTVTAQLHQRPGAPADDVTAALLRGSTILGSTVTATLEGGGATVGTTYAVHVVATLAGGGRLQETIRPLVCDE